MKRNNGLLITALVLMIILLTGLCLWVNREEEIGVTVARASRELALMLEDKAVIEENPDSRFPVGDRGNWYVPYMDYLYDRGMLSGQLTSATAKTAAGALTLEMLKVMADHLGIWQEPDRWQEQQVSAGLWMEFLTEVWERFGKDAVKTTELSVYGTAANLEGIEPWRVVTQSGEYSFGGFSMDTYMDRQVSTWVRGQEIILVREVISNQVTYKNMLVEQADKDSLTVFFSGYPRSFSLEETVELYPDQIIDLGLENGKLKVIRRKNDRLNSRIIAVTGEGAELEGYGKVPFSEELRVYQTYGKTAQKSVSDIVIGYDLYDVLVADGEICAVLIRQSPDARTIRVLLSEGSGAVMRHDQVTVTSPSNFYVTMGGQRVMYAAGEMVSVTSEGVSGIPTGKPEEGQRIYVEADCGQLTVTSLTRTFGHPTYPGKLELLYQNGGFYVINETTVEDYLCHVVPAEMPVDYHVEALKAQAICARGYAVNQISSTRYRDIGAHVDDTVNYQVYNYVAGTENTTRAVRETYGKVLTRGGEIVTTYYFSTSCGYTSDLALWGEDPAKSPHLTSKRLSGAEPTENVREEETFSAFIKDRSLNDYEIAYGWYRWNTTISLEELTVGINRRLAGISPSLKNRVLTKQRDGSWREGAVTVGMVEKIEVIERGAGGVASVVEITGSQATVRLLLQSAIREVLGDHRYRYHRMNGDVITNWANLPSAYFCLEPVHSEEKLIGYTLYGGGCGHGVGMSQNGANALGQLGVSAEEMLTFFYDGTEITPLYQ